jgi:hypothetical protein
MEKDSYFEDSFESTCYSQIWKRIPILKIVLKVLVIHKYGNTADIFRYKL